jgi:hypothetical protein
VATRTIDLGYRARPQFRAFHARKQRWACLVVHRRGGKTVACIMDLIDAALRCDKEAGRFAYFAPTYAQAKDTAWQYVKRFTANIPGVEQRESDLMVTFPNGARIRLYGAETYDRLRGTYSDGIVCDEYGDFDPRAWPEVLRPSLADRNGWAVFIGTPKGRNDFWRIHSSAETNPDWYSMVLKASVSGLLPEAELADMRSMMSADQYDQEMEVSFDAAARELGSGKTREEILRANGRKVRILPAQSIEDGIEAVKMMLGRCWFDRDKTVRGRECLAHYRRDFNDRMGIYKASPVHDWSSDSSDSLRYMAMGLRETAPRADAKPRPRPLMSAGGSAWMGS